MADEATLEVAVRAKRAAVRLQIASADQKNAALAAIKTSLCDARESVCRANRQDKEDAERAVSAGDLSSSLFKRLDIENPDKFQALLDGLDDVAKLDDPTGKVTLARRLDDGLDLYRVTCPVGVVCIIFEARPEVVIQISSLAIKSGNAVILKGGREAAHSNEALVSVVRAGLAAVPGFPEDAVQLVSTREQVSSLLSLDRYIDLVIPRGGNALVRYVQSHTRIPVLGHADGICSVFIDATADVKKAVRVSVDSKAQYVAACNSAETLLVHRDVLSSTFQVVASALVEAGVRLRCDERAFSALSPHDAITRASDADFHTEFLDLIMAVKVVDSLDDAIAHINAHGSRHTESIVTESDANAERFMALVDAAGVYHNASTRFADGYRYGFGAEIGVSTNKTHARGPVGLEGLMIYKYRMYGNGQRVADFSGTDARRYMHTDIPAEERRL
eukprot:Opistho-2@84562